MVERVDLVLLESQEGRPHLEQAAPALAAGKPMYIDKPVAASLVDAVRIYQLANESGTPCFSSSANRFIPEVVGLRTNPQLGRIVGCDAYSPSMMLEYPSAASLRSAATKNSVTNLRRNHCDDGRLRRRAGDLCQVFNDV